MSYNIYKLYYFSGETCSSMLICVTSGNYYLYSYIQVYTCILHYITLKFVIQCIQTLRMILSVRIEINKVWIWIWIYTFLLLSGRDPWLPERGRGLNTLPAINFRLARWGEGNDFPPWLVFSPYYDVGYLISPPAAIGKIDRIPDNIISFSSPPPHFFRISPFV